MTERKRRNATPFFKMPSPFNPIDGDHAKLKEYGIHPYCGLVQIAAEDTHNNYVVCQLFDTRVMKLYGYDKEDTDTQPGIPVAKPYGNRTPGRYEVGQVFPALLPFGRQGQNPGVAADSQGHPADLDEEVGILSDENGVVINWILLDADSGTGLRFYNDSGEEVPPYALMAVTGVKELPDEKLVKIGKPSTTFYRHYLVNGATAVPSTEEEEDNIGTAQDSEIVKVAYDNEGNPAVGEGWGPKPGQWTAAENYPETCIVAEILDVDSVMLARLSPIDTVIGELDGALTKGGTATVKVWGGAQGSEAIITDLTVEGAGWLAGRLASGTRVVVEWINGIPYVVGGDSGQYVKTQTAIAGGNKVMTSQYTVSVKQCLADGTGETGAAFDVKTPLSGDNKYTSVFVGKVFRIGNDASGDLQIISASVEDDAFNTTKGWHTTDAPPQGWSILTNSATRVIAGYDSGNSPYDTIGATFGAEQHIHPTHTIANHDLSHVHASTVGCPVDVGSAFDAWNFDAGPNTQGENPDLSAVAHASGAGAGLAHAAMNNYQLSLVSQRIIRDA